MYHTCLQALCDSLLLESVWHLQTHRGPGCHRQRQTGHLEANRRVNNIIVRQCYITVMTQHMYCRLIEYMMSLSSMYSLTSEYIIVF